jgi:hypothetical protein
MPGRPSDLQFAYTLAGNRSIRCDVILTPDESLESTDLRLADTHVRSRA